MKPLTLLVKPAAGLCNMNCSYCFYRSASAGRENRIMTYETADLLIRRIKKYRPSALTVMFQGGEPTLAGLDFYVYFCGEVKKNLRVPVNYALQTNGLLIDGEYAAFFKENRFLLGLSLDGDRQTNDRSRFDGSGGVFDRVMKCAGILNRHGVDFNILAVVDNDSVNELKTNYRFFKENGFKFIQFIPRIDPDDSRALTEANYELFLKETFDLWYEDYIAGEYVSVRHIDNYMGILLGSPPENCAMCGVCGNYFTVEANGDIYPCDFYCDDEYRVASLTDEKPFEITGKHREFIEQSKIIHEHCRGCDYHFICRGGCKRDRINGFTENRYCKAYIVFFEYAGERMMSIVREIKNEKA